MQIFEVTKRFPGEKFSLNQIRRSARSVCTNFAEAYRKSMVDFALSCKYIVQEEYDKYINLIQSWKTIMARNK
jgi:hypothetical protein